MEFSHFYCESYDKIKTESLIKIFIDTSLNKVLMNNSTLSKLLKNMIDKTKTVEKSSDILDVVNMAIEYNGKIEYNNRVNYSISTIGAFLLAVSYYQYINYNSPYLFLFIGLLLIIASIGQVIYRKSIISNLTHLLFDMDLKFDNKIEPVTLNCEERGLLQSRFTEFERGNYKREFKSFYKISKKDMPESIYYRYHYVDKRTELVVSTDKDGNTTTSTRTIYDHFDRYGIVFDFKYGAGLSINSSGITKNQVKYVPAYREFSKRFQIGANSEHDASKMLKAAILIGVVELSEKFKQLNIQISNCGSLLIGFDEEMLKEVKCKHSLKDPQAFYDELKGVTEIENLESAYELYELLNKHLNNNFE